MSRITVHKVRKFLKTMTRFLFNPRFLLCFGAAWLITNGWSYVLLVVGSYFQIPWMITLATAYLTFLWLPISPEKLVTVLIAMALLKFFFPNDEKTLGILKDLHARFRLKHPQKKSK